MRINDLCARKDIVLDTNVIAHASNPNDPTQADCFRILDWLRLTTAVDWTLDDNGKEAPDPRTSVLVKEYRATLAPGSLGLELLTHFLQSGRVAYVPRPKYDVRKKIEKLIPANKADRVVLGAAHGSSSRVLVTDDYADFPDSVRKIAKKSLKVNVLGSAPAVA